MQSCYACLEHVNTRLCDNTYDNGIQRVARVQSGQLTHLRSMIITCIGLIMVSYFAFHTLQGERGLLSYLRLSENLENAQAELGDLQQQAYRLEKRVTLLRTDSLDTDMLEERARAVLNYTRKNDIIILPTALDAENNISESGILTPGVHQIDG